jgi:hypothetical protein
MHEGERRRRRIRGSRTTTDPAPVDAAPMSIAGPPAVLSEREPAPERPPLDDARPAARPKPMDHGHHPMAIDLDGHRPGPAHDDRDSERGLRGLIGGGSSQVSVTAAMRARDAARPTDEDIAHAEATLNIVHRGWVPRDQ